MFQKNTHNIIGVQLQTEIIVFSWIGSHMLINSNYFNIIINTYTTLKLYITTLFVYTKIYYCSYTLIFAHGKLNSQTNSKIDVLINPTYLTFDVKLYAHALNSTYNYLVRSN